MTDSELLSCLESRLAALNEHAEALGMCGALRKQRLYRLRVTAETAMAALRNSFELAERIISDVEKAAAKTPPEAL